MAINRNSPIAQHLRQAVLRTDAAGLTDGQLLECYLRHREDAAFAALVRRHGPMVLGVCRRILGNTPDAEDAFQASFLVLVRKAASITPPERVGSWLYGVAHVTARRARALIARRRLRERQVQTMPEPASEPALWNDLAPLLDEELARLPDKYRAAIVLCDLEDRSIKEAAQHLCWPQGTVAGRLARGRVMLAKRLARRGVGLSGGALAALLSQQAASAALPAGVMASTVEAGKRLMAGQGASALISSGVIVLMEGALRAMFLTKLKTTALVLFGMTVLALSTLGGFYRATAGDEPQAPPPPPTRAEGTPAAGDEGDEPQLPDRSSQAPLPATAMPRQALVRLDKGQLSVRTLEVMYEPITMMFQGQRHTSYQKVEVLKTRTFLTRMVKVYDMHGKQIHIKKLPELLKKETVALVSSDEQAADPLNLRLFKEGTLLFILPAYVPPPTPAPVVPAVPAEAPPAPPAVEVVPPPPAVEQPMPPLRYAPALPVPRTRSRVPPRSDAPVPPRYDAPTIPLSPARPAVPPGQR